MSNSINDFFCNGLSMRDSAVNAAILAEERRQSGTIELIASENIVSKAVLEAQGSVLTNKYAEGYPGKRYYGGCDEVDKVETIAIERVKALFAANYANVQPHSGSQANQAVFFSLLHTGDTIMGLDLASGGHLTHGAKFNLSGKLFNAVFYSVDRDTCLIDFDQVEALAKHHKPKMIIAGGSGYSRIVDFARFREIADSIGAFLLVDMAHFAGLVAGGVYPNPINHAHIVTSTTHKTLRGPRGGIVLTQDEAIAKKINSTVFPGLQGGPLMHVIAAKAVAFGEALTPEFKEYAKAVVENAKIFAAALIDNGFNIITGGTDSHLALIDLRPKKVTGLIVEKALDRVAITVNKNAIPYDPEKPTTTSGIRVGTPACTTRGFGGEEFRLTASWIAEVIDGLARNGEDNNQRTEQEVARKVANLCGKFPIYR